WSRGSAIQPRGPTAALIRSMAAAISMLPPQHSRSGYSAFPRRGGATQPVVDRPAETVLRDRHHRNGCELGPVETAQHRKQVCRGLHEVAGPAQPQHLGETGRHVWAEGQQSLTGLRADRVEAQWTRRRIMARQHARRFGLTLVRRSDWAE